jgi:hypothetical protein
MTSPDPATAAALDACYASAADTIPEIVETTLAYARPLIEAAERERIRQLAIECKATWVVGCDNRSHDGQIHTHHRVPFADKIVADLLDGDTP